MRSNEIVGKGTVRAVCVPKGHRSPKEHLESCGEGYVIRHSTKKSNNISFINVDVSDKRRDGSGRGLRGSRGVWVAEQAWPRGHVSEVWEGKMARELSVHVIVTKNIVIDVRTV